MLEISKVLEAIFDVIFQYYFSFILGLWKLSITYTSQNQQNKAVPTIQISKKDPFSQFVRLTSRKRKSREVLSKLDVRVQ